MGVGRVSEPGRRIVFRTVRKDVSRYSMESDLARALTHTLTSSPSRSGGPSAPIVNPRCRVCVTPARIGACGQLDTATLMDLIELLQSSTVRRRRSALLAGQRYASSPPELQAAVQCRDSGPSMTSRRRTPRPLRSARRRTLRRHLRQRSWLATQRSNCDRQTGSTPVVTHGVYRHLPMLWKPSDWQRDLRGCTGAEDDSSAPGCPKQQAMYAYVHGRRMCTIEFGHSCELLAGGSKPCPRSPGVCRCRLPQSLHLAIR